MSAERQVRPVDGRPVLPVVVVLRGESVVLPRVKTGMGTGTGTATT